MLSKPLIEARAVSQIYSTNNGTPGWALKNASLAIDPGEFVCVIGPSGCGKSTLLHMIAGFITPTDGELRFRGEPILKPGPERGVVFQEYALFAWMTALQNVECAGLRARSGASEPCAIWIWWACGAPRIVIRMNSPAACASASRWRVR